MNPSKNLWVTKFFKLSNPSFFINQSENQFYEEIRKTGFVYGYTTKTIQQEFESFDLTPDELIKIVLLEALYGTYLISTKNKTINDFLIEVEIFYKTITNISTDSFFSFIKLTENKNYKKNIEEIINERTNRKLNHVDLSFSSHLSNFLLFTDVLSFKRYLINKNEILSYYKYLEKTIVQLVFQSYYQKKTPSKYDNKLLEILEKSLRYSNIHEIKNNNFTLNFSNIVTSYGKLYLFDITLMVLWSDNKIDENEYSYLNKISQKLSINNRSKLAALESIVDFIQKNKANIPYFQFHHPLKKLYKKTNTTIIYLIKRNKNSIAKELKNNKKLAEIVVKSTYANLSKQEKVLLKNQLIELGKTIPALTIFVIPGGSLLLPIFLKLLPELLPKSFNENKS